MTDLLLLAVYLVGWFAAALFIAWPRQGVDPDEDGMFAAVVLGLLWPLWLAVATALLPFAAVGWLVSQVTERVRAREAS